MNMPQSLQQIASCISGYDPDALPVAQAREFIAQLVPRVQQLIDQAAAANINLTIDAEECDRLELSLELFDRLARGIAQRPEEVA